MSIALHVGVTEVWTSCFTSKVRIVIPEVYLYIHIGKAVGPQEAFIMTGVGGKHSVQKIARTFKVRTVVLKIQERRLSG